MVTICIILLIFLSLNSCSDQVGVKTYSYKVEDTYPHDISSYTQGLFFYDGNFYESSGQYGESCFRQVDLKSGKVLKRMDFDGRYFAEGSVVLDGKLYILTWQENECFVYDINSWERLDTFTYDGEGWGLTTDGESLIMSDGTSEIEFRDPATFDVKRSVTVTMNGRNVIYINELEYIKGEIWANLYGTNMIARIDPSDGKVLSLVNCNNLLPASKRSPRTDVLNGIAYDSDHDKLYLTGKYWPELYRIKLVSKK